MASYPLHDPSSPEYKKARRHYLKTAQNNAKSATGSLSPFRAAEKKYKAFFPPPELGDCLDLAIVDPERADEIMSGVWMGSLDALEYKEVPLVDSDSSKKAYIIQNLPGRSSSSFVLWLTPPPGLVVLPGYLDTDEQRRLIRWSLSEQARHPNPTNLDVHYELPSEGIWNLHLKCSSHPHQDDLIHPKKPCESPVQEPAGPRQLINNEAGSMQDYETSNTPKPDAPPSGTLKSTHCSKLLPQLRWANIGWYYHWGSKQYDFARGKVEVDSHLKALCRRVVSQISWEEVFGTTDASTWGVEGPDWSRWPETYEPDAGIVNFYQTKDTLMAHVDRSEICATSPLVSISIGNAAVFLIGGTTRETEPAALILRSGDVVIMAGPSCRRAYHGVPRILEGSLPSHLGTIDSGDWEEYKNYMLNTRININVRQVFPRGYEPAREPPVN